MATESDRALKILLQVQADTAGIGEIDRDINKLKGTLNDASQAGTGLSTALISLIGGVAGGVFVTLAREVGRIPGMILEAQQETVKWNAEISAQTNEIEANIRQWTRLAGVADSIKDQFKLSDVIAKDLEKAAANYAAWRSKELSLWATFIDTIAKQWSAIPGFGATPMQTALDEATKAARNNEILMIQSRAAAADKAAASDANWQRQQADLAAGMPEVHARIEGLNIAIREQENIIKTIGVKGLGMTDTELAEAQAAVDEVSRLNEQLANEEGHLTKLDALQKQADSKGAAADKRAEAEARRAFNATLVEERLQLEAIRSAIANIESSPFLTIGQKNVALTELIPSQIATINAMIEQNKSQLSNSFFDPAQHNALQAAIQRDEAAIVGLQQKLQLTSFTGQFRASLVSFVNQVGTTAQQVGQAITSTIGIAISGVSNAIMGAITRTQSWGQAFAQVAQSIIGNLIQIGLQFIAQKVLGSILTATTVTEQTTAGAAIAAANAPAAAATSIASYGGAAVAGGSAAMAAIAAIMGALGGFEIGGFTGPGGSSDLAGVVHRGEYVMPKSAVDSAGVGAMDSFRASAEGGRGGGGVAIFNFTDMKALEKAYLQSTAAKKMIIHTVNGAGGNLRT